jgi:PAS domain S-box-containing protein
MAKRYDIAVIRRQEEETVTEPSKPDVVELFLQQRTHELLERTKELGCLYSVSNVIERKNMPLDEILQAVVRILPPSWQYPEITCGRIIFEGREFTTSVFRETPWGMASDIVLSGKRCGCVEVFYLEEKPEAMEGPFLKEERDLIDEIAFRINQEIEYRRAEKEMRDSEERYRNLVQRLPFAVLVLDENRISFANKEFSTLVGAGPEYVLEGRQFLDFVHVDFRPPLRERIRVLEKTNDAVPALEIKLIRLVDKSAVDVEASFVIADSAIDGKIQLVLQDIRDRREVEARNLFERLSKRERQIMQMVVLGETSKVIAAHLGVSPKTIENHRVRLMKKMNAQSLADLIRKARMLGNY